MKTFVIAEAGVNHNGSLKKAMKLVDIAAKANVDAIKFQTFLPGEILFFHENIIGVRKDWSKIDSLPLSPPL